MCNRTSEWLEEVFKEFKEKCGQDYWTWPQWQEYLDARVPCISNPDQCSLFCKYYGGYENESANS